MLLVGGFRPLRTRWLDDEAGFEILIHVASLLILGSAVPLAWLVHEMHRPVREVPAEGEGQRNRTSAVICRLPSFWGGLSNNECDEQKLGETPLGLTRLSAMVMSLGTWRNSAESTPNLSNPGISQDEIQKTNEETQKVDVVCDILSYYETKDESTDSDKPNGMPPPSDLLLINTLKEQFQQFSSK